MICGIGRTGPLVRRRKRFRRSGSDLMTLRQGHCPRATRRIGGVMVSDRVGDVLVEKGGEFYHGFTYSAHPVACAVALATLKVLRDENLVERVRDDRDSRVQQPLAEARRAPAGGRGAFRRA
ncbi:MAG: aminotransferase class III-fold pyridoxal phosphate-dependent enzyme [Rhodopseudomonas palustris]|nr:aminotransferase class III-fold pyridoxal phosphate-dependent enzyme [Rhodopseudomonas palustris]